MFESIKNWGIFQAWTDSSLILAVKNNDLAAVKKLIETESFLRPKANPAVRHGYCTPLYLAVLKGNDEIADYLKTYPAAVMQSVECALLTDDIGMIMNVFNGRGLNAPLNKNGETLLHVAARVGMNSEMLDCLIRSGADALIEMKDPKTGRMVLPSEVAQQNDSLYAYVKLKQAEREALASGRKPYQVFVEEELQKPEPEPEQVIPMTKAELKKMKPDELEKELTTNDTMIKRLLITGLLADAFKIFPYDKSREIYKKVAPKLDISNRHLVEETIRAQR